MKSQEEVMQILEAYDLAGTYRAAAELTGVSHHTIARYVVMRDAGRVPVIGEGALEGLGSRAPAEWLPLGWHATRGSGTPLPIERLGVVFSGLLPAARGELVAGSGTLDDASHEPAPTKG